MKIKLKIIYDKILKLIRINLFKSTIPLSYILFNFVYKLIIQDNKKIRSETIKNFQKNGFVDLNINFKKEFDLAFKNFVDEKKFKWDNKKNRDFYLFETEEKEKLIKILNRKFENLFHELSDHYNSNVKIVGVQVFKTYNPFNSKKNFNSQDDEFFSDHFHFDAYLKTYSKIFVSLNDMSLDRGPTIIIPKTKIKNFIKSTNYKGRANYDKTFKIDEKSENAYINLGKNGDSILCNTTEVLHRASIPNEERTIMIITINALPYDDKIFLNKGGANFGKLEKKNYNLQIAKPNNLKEIFFLLIRFISFKKSFLSTK